MSPRARKILLAAALFCSCASAFAFYRRYRPLAGTAFRYEIRDDGLVWRLKWSTAEALPALAGGTVRGRLVRGGSHSAG